ncbi:MAG: hypothetical protein ACLU9S_06890 [Oscillospiraceae bacterium]
MSWLGDGGFCEPSWPSWFASNLADPDKLRSHPSRTLRTNLCHNGRCREIL